MTTIGEKPERLSSCRRRGLSAGLIEAYIDHDPGDRSEERP
jgi:hypothetical protein